MKKVRGIAVIGLFGALAVTGMGQTIGRERCDRPGYGQAQYRPVSDRAYEPQYRRPSGYYAQADRYDRERRADRYDRERYADRYENDYRGRGGYYGRGNGGYYGGPNGGYYGNPNSGYYGSPYGNGDGYYYERPASHSAAIIGGGAAAGAAVGGMTAGKKGAIIGAAAGGAAGLIYDRKTRYGTRW